MITTTPAGPEAPVRPLTPERAGRATVVAPGPGGAEEEPLHLAPAVAAPPIPDAPLGSNRDFWVVLLGQGISSFGDAITNTALPILVLALTGSGLAMGIVGVLATLPDLVVGLPAGAYADRWDRRRMMFAADLGRALLTAVIPLSVWLGGPTLALILLVAFPLNVLRVLWLAGFTAAVPGLVGRGQIARAKGLTSGLIFYVTIDRGLGAGVVGIVLSAFAVGSLGGSLVAARLAFRAVGRVMLAGTLVTGLALLVVALDVPVAVLAGAAFVAGVLQANVLVSYLTLRTQLSPDALLGRVGATARTLSVGLMPLGALGAGVLLDAAGAATTLAVKGAGSIAAGLGFAILPTVRHARVPRRFTAG